MDATAVVPTTSYPAPAKAVHPVATAGLQHLTRAQLLKRLGILLNTPSPTPVEEIMPVIPLWASLRDRIRAGGTYALDVLFLLLATEQNYQKSKKAMVVPDFVATLNLDEEEEGTRDQDLSAGPKAGGKKKRKLAVAPAA